MSEPPLTADGTPLDPCGCCETPGLDGTVANRPGLPALRYRVGTYATFLRRMLARLPLQAIPTGENEGLRPLQGLTTRPSDDPAIALLDAWATVGDVLTFYQERITNEGFLGTASERRSLLELARAIGYELSPGVAASTYLSFTVEEPVIVPSAAVPPERRAFQGGPGSAAPTLAIVPAGAQVQSIPGPGESAQTFETSAELEARVEWNALRPRLTRPQPLDPGARSVWVEGIVNDLRAGGRLLFITRDAENQVLATPKQVVAVTPEDALGRTRLDLAEARTTPTFVPPVRSGLTFERPTLSAANLSAAAAGRLVLNRSWRESDLSAFLGIQRWDVRALHTFARTLRQQRASLAPASFDLEPPEPGLFALTVKSSPFGHNAPRYKSLPANQRKGGTDVVYPEDWDQDPPSIAQDSTRTEYRRPTSMGGTADDAHFFFERVVPEVLPGGWVLLEGGGTPKVVRVAEVKEASLADFALSGRATGVLAENHDGTDLQDSALAGFKLRSTTLHAGSRPLALAPLPIEEDVGEGTAEAGQLTLDGLVLGLPSGRPVALTGERADLPGVIESEVVAISEVIHSEGFTTLVFASGLKQRYLRRTVTLNANVVAATHGESVTEVLGSGSGAVPNPRFTLKKPPLTYVSADAPSGAASTLEVRVNDLLWEEVPSLYGLAPQERGYTIRIDDEARASIIFGDGRQGARPPTSIENVVARYRSGIGLQGEVEVGALSLLLHRPLGIREVTNPVPATGAADPETLTDARDNAPRTVRTLERIVSLQDYTDFARGFAGIGKAEAVVLWTGRDRLVSLTIASASGAPVAETSQLYANLVAGIQAARAPLEAFRVSSFQPVFFNLEASVRIERAYLPEKVLAAVEAALREAFSFARRRFGQAVTAAEAVAVIHSVEGVVAVDLDALHLATEAGTGTGSLSTLLPARGARWEAGEVALAELLLLNPAGIELTEMQS
ncbi:MAG: putative baseplate assembly protein [Longimicrobiaceae bacterium]